MPVPESLIATLKKYKGLKEAERKTESFRTNRVGQTSGTNSNPKRKRLPRENEHGEKVSEARQQML